MAQMLAALQALYHHDDPAVKDQANKFLEQWQQTTEAWSVSDAVLHDPASAMEVQYFCAQTLRTKVQRDFEELPATAIDSLRDSLLALLIKYAKGAPPVRTQLCLALVALTVHVPADRWDAQGSLAWFATKLQALPQDTAIPCLLELLTVLPQEVNSMKYAVRPERRRQHASELRAATAQAISILTGCWGAATSARQRPAVLEAFGAWLRLSEGAALGPDGSQLSSHPLVAAALEGLKSNGDLFHAACDAVCELVWCTVDVNTRQIDVGMMALIQALVPAVIALRPRFAVASHRAAEDMAEEQGDLHRSGSKAAPATDEFDDDEHTAKGMARLFAEVGEAYVHLVATAVQEVQAPVEALLEVAAHPEPTIAAMSFNFWHKLARSISSGFGPKESAQGCSGNGGVMEVIVDAAPEGQAAMAEQARRQAFFKPAFERLISVVRGKVKFPAGCTHWSKEAFIEFRKHRYEIADSLEDCAAVLGFERSLAMLVEPLAGAFEWRTTEAALFCVRAIAPYSVDLPPGHPQQLTQLLAALPAMPRDAPLLQTCCCYAIARYAQWLNSALTASAGGGSAPSGEAAALLQALLQMAVSCLEMPECSASAASAVLDLCAYCGRFMTPCIQPLMDLNIRLLGAGAAGQIGGAVAAGTLARVPEEDVQVVLHAVCVATCKCLPPSAIPAAAAALLLPVLGAAQRAAAALPSDAGAHLSNQAPHMGPLLDRLGLLFAHVDNRQAVADMLAQSWPTLDLVFSRTMGDVRLLERACRTMRLGIKGAAREAGPLLPALVSSLAARFQSSRHSAFLYILSELIKIFGPDAHHAATLSGVMASLLIDACSGLRSLDQLNCAPELTDDTFLLACRVLSYAPQLLLLPPTGQTYASSAPCQALLALLDTSLIGVLVQHREACCSVLGFLSRLLSPGLSDSIPGTQTTVQSVMLPRAPMLTRLLLAGVVGVLPSARVSDIAALFAGMLRAGGSQALQWLSESVALLPDAVVEPNDKSLFMASASAAGGRASTGTEDRLWEGSVEELAELCRRNPRVRQAAQQAVLPRELHNAVAA